MKFTAATRRASAPHPFPFAPLRGYLLRLAFALLTLGLAATLRAHDHVEVGLDPAVPARLALAGPAAQLALHVPRGEPFSAYLPLFPGGAYATELTFSAEGNTLELAPDALPRVELVSVTGPAGASLSFWEPGATTPTWSRPTGWTAAEGERPSLAVYEDATGYGHIHGRAFSVDAAGVYQVVFRALDETARHAPSLEKTVVFTALDAPQLCFTSRANLSYDLQVSTTLADDDWSTIDFVSGTGGPLEFTDPLAARPRVFYRLVEYR
jgi:hypothetical protein